MEGTVTGSPLKMLVTSVGREGTLIEGMLADGTLTEGTVTGSPLKMLVTSVGIAVLMSGILTEGTLTPLKMVVTLSGTLTGRLTLLRILETPSGMLTEGTLTEGTLIGRSVVIPVGRSGTLTEGTLIAGVTAALAGMGRERLVGRGRSEIPKDVERPILEGRSAA